jgi:uncharacterized protein YijF (DUF1287 family)
MMNKPKIKTIALITILVISTACTAAQRTVAQLTTPAASKIEKPALALIKSDKIKKMLKSANDQTRSVTGYTQKYYSIPYPNGDVPANTGACTDVVIRSLRAAGVDLQKEVHEDMKSNFSMYPKKWGLSRTDTNIDHRRVPNLQKYFERNGKALEISRIGSNYKPGDIVAWDLNGKGMTHIGVVSNIWNESDGRYFVIHNIGGGTELEDRLFAWEIIGHYRMF